MLRWDLDENDAYPVRIGDPHLRQAPRFPFGCRQDLDTGRLEAPVRAWAVSLPSGQNVADSRPVRVFSYFYRMFTSPATIPLVIRLMRAEAISRPADISSDTTSRVPSVSAHSLS